jgi:hypothetical protein
VGDAGAESEDFAMVLESPASMEILSLKSAFNEK